MDRPPTDRITLLPYRARIEGARLRHREPGVVIADAHSPRDWALRRMLAAADSAALISGFAIMVAVSTTGRPDRDFLAGAATIPVWLVLLKAYGCYDRDFKRISHTGIDDIPSLFHVMLLGCLLLWSYFYALSPHHIGLSEILTFGSVAAGLMLPLRAIARILSRRVFGPERVLLVGDGPSVDLLARKMRAHSEYGLEPVGVLAAGEAVSGELRVPHFGGLVAIDLPRIVDHHRVERVVLAQGEFDDAELLALMRTCKELRIKVNVLPQLFDAMGPTMVVDDVEGVTVLGIHPPVLSRSSRALKRVMDVIGAVALAICAAPLFLLIAIGIRLDSRGPVFFSQTRIGRRGKRFKLVKFRTMTVDAERQRSALLAMSMNPNWLHVADDPRITRFGHFLRRTSMDELPQIWNVLRGEMSLVGPRPLIEDEDRHVAGWGRTRIELTPGMTGLWQVLGRTNIPFEEMVKLDYMYATNWSLWSDIRLILRTVPVLISRRGAN